MTMFSANNTEFKKEINVYILYSRLFLNIFSRLYNLFSTSPSTNLRTYLSMFGVEEGLDLCTGLSLLATPGSGASPKAWTTA